MAETALRRRILVVEDEPAIARILESFLGDEGYDVHSELTGTGAMAYAAEHQPDMVILDLRLPDIHGYEVCKELRRRHEAWVMPIIMLTALDAPLDRLRGLAHGADAYLTKPFEPPALLPTIQFLLSKTESQPEAP
jgi:two-component system response regulator VicR